LYTDVQRLQPVLPGTPQVTGGVAGVAEVGKNVSTVTSEVVETARG